jgi:hypothetical protein
MPANPTTDLLTLILSIAAITLSVCAIVFEAVFFSLQRNEARNLTKSVQELVSQAIRSEKGIDQLSDQTMPLIDRLVQAQVSADRAKAGPEVEKLVRDLLKPVEAGLAELDKRLEAAPQSGELRQEMDSKLAALREQMAQIARRAGERAASDRPLVRAPASVAGEDAQDVAGLLLTLAGAGGAAADSYLDDAIGDAGMAARPAAANLGLVELVEDVAGLTDKGRAVAERLRDHDVSTDRVLEIRRSSAGTYVVFRDTEGRVERIQVR